VGVAIMGKGGVSVGFGGGGGSEVSRRIEESVGIGTELGSLESTVVGTSVGGGGGGELESEEDIGVDAGRAAVCAPSVNNTHSRNNTMLP